MEVIQAFKQELAYIFISIICILGLFKTYSVIGFSKIVVIAFVLGYALSALDDEYVHPSILGGLTWALIASLILAWWTKRKTKKEQSGGGEE